MSYYAIHHAESIGAAEGRSLIVRLLRNWRTRRRLARLAHLDDGMLEDVGLRRRELARALALPLTANASEELERSAFRQRIERARRHPSAKLADPDDRTLQLQDVGLTEEELGWALSVPLTLNLTEELEQAAFRQRIEAAGKLRGRRATQGEATEPDRTGQAALRKMAMTVVVVVSALAVAALAPDRKAADVFGLQLLAAANPAQQN